MADVRGNPDTQEMEAHWQQRSVHAKDMLVLVTELNTYRGMFLPKVLAAKVVAVQESHPNCAFCQTYAGGAPALVGFELEEGRKPAHRNAIEALRNRHEGQRCFLLGTGPSIAHESLWLLSQLGKEITFGVNRLLAIPGWPFMPTYYTMREAAGLHDITEMLNEASGRFGMAPERWIAHEKAPRQQEFSDWHWIQTSMDHDMTHGDFNAFGDTLEYVVPGNSSLFTCALPLAIWSGCKKVYLLGCDATSTGYAYAPEQARGDNLQLDGMIAAAQVAHAQMKDHGVELVDLTQGGQLTIPKDTLANVLVEVS